MSIVKSYPILLHLWLTVLDVIPYTSKVVSRKKYAVVEFYKELFKTKNSMVLLVLVLDIYPV